MSFLSPFFLLAITAVGIPLIIHLLNLRKPNRIKFSTLAFFEELKKTTIRKIRIKRYLLLLLRLLAVACLAFVLARPFLPPGVGSSGSSQTPALNAILIDNSISMSRIGEKGPLFDQVKSIVQSIEESSKESDRFILQVTNGSAQYSTIIGHGQLLKRIEQLEIAPAGNFGTQRVEEIYEVLNDAPYQNKRLFIITDGQKNQFDELKLAEIESNTITSTFIVLENVETQNTVISKLESSTNMIGVGLPVKLSVTVQNRGEIPIANQYVSLEFQEELVGQYSLSMEANSSRIFSFDVTPSSTGSSNGKIIIEGDEFNADNEFFFTIEVPEAQNILWVSDDNLNVAQNSYTEMVLNASTNNDAQLSYKKAKPEILSTTEIGNFNAIILDGLSSVPEFAMTNLTEFVQSGKGILFFPSEKGDIRNYNAFLNAFNIGSFEGIIGEYGSFKTIAKGETLQEDHPIFSGLFELAENEDVRIANPDIYYYFKLKPSNSPGGFNILTLNTKDPLIREKRFGAGKVIISGIGNTPSWSNFSIKPLYAPLYYRTMLYAASTEEGGFSMHTLGSEFNWNGKINSENTMLVIDGLTVVPEARVNAGGTVITYPAESWIPGWITLKDNTKSYSIATNLDRSESEFVQLEKPNFNQIKFVDASELQGASLANEIKASGFGKEIWSWFMLAGLIFLVTESLVSIFYKAETIS